MVDGGNAMKLSWLALLLLPACSAGGLAIPGDDSTSSQPTTNLVGGLTGGDTEVHPMVGIGVDPDNRSDPAVTNPSKPTDPPHVSGYGLTWAYFAEATLPQGETHMSCHGVPHEVDHPWSGSCNPYSGDTPCSAVRPILCLKKDGSQPAPSSYDIGFYNGWVGGVLASSAPDLGGALTSRAAADALCKIELGEGFVMAEFHDAGGGWGFVGETGALDTSKRHWVAIDDQPGNCWNSSN
jgi:hypothetical protein